MTREILVSLVSLLLAGGAGATGPLPYANTADELLAEIGNRGAPEVALELYNSASWIPAMVHVEAGERDWLLVALALSPGTDGAATTDLYRSISKALLSNPEAVMELFLSLEPPRSTICMGQAEIAGHETSDAAYAELEAKVARVEKVTDPALSGLKAACLASLRASEGRLRAIYGP